MMFYSVHATMKPYTSYKHEMTSQITALTCTLRQRNTIKP